MPDCSMLPVIFALPLPPFRRFVRRAAFASNVVGQRPPECDFAMPAIFHGVFRHFVIFLRFRTNQFEYALQYRV